MTDSRQATRNAHLIPLSLTFDDVLLKPQFSTLRSRKEANISSRVSRNIKVALPFVASNMIDICEEAMAICLARLGAVGVLHRFCTTAQQVEMVKRVKRAQTSHIDDPRTTQLDTPREELERQIAWSGRRGGVSSLMVVDKDRRLLGVVSRTDLTMAPEECTARDIMVPFERLITTTNPDMDVKEAASLMLKHRVSDLPIIDDQTNRLLVGLITRTDVRRRLEHTNATIDSRKRLVVGAAVGVKLPHDLHRAQELVKHGADFLVVDIAHGHSAICVDMIKALKGDPVTSAVDIVAGNIATKEGAETLAKAGADALKVGVGPGSICVTRIVAGAGNPQLSALLECCGVARKYGIPVIADGGIRAGGDVSKAMAAGADTVMLGSLLGGTDETPGRIMTRDGQKRKLVRGMAGLDTNLEKARREGKDENEVYENLVPEGVEGTVPYRGAARNVIFGLQGGLRSGMSYSNARCLKEMREKAIFVRMSGAGLRESGAHDISKL